MSGRIPGSVDIWEVCGAVCTTSARTRDVREFTRDRAKKIPVRQGNCGGRAGIGSVADGVVFGGCQRKAAGRVCAGGKEV